MTIQGGERILLLELHRLIEESAEDALRTIRAPRERRSVFYPPGYGLGTVDPAGLAMRELAAALVTAGTTSDLDETEIGALQGLPSSGPLEAALRKVVTCAAGQALFHMFCLLDGVADPQVAPVPLWQGLGLGPKQEDAEMLHDAFVESYWDYKERRGAADTSD